MNQLTFFTISTRYNYMIKIILVVLILMAIVYLTGAAIIKSNKTKLLKNVGLTTLIAVVTLSILSFVVLVF